MSTLSLKISLDEGKVVKTMQFDPSITVYDACKVIREKITEATGEPKDYGLFLSSNEDNKKGVWLEPARSLEYYILRNGDVVEYKRKLRTLRVRMLDGSVKTMMVDDSQIIANLMVVICTKIGITNYDEYSLVREEQKDDMDTCESKPNYGTLTLKRKHAEKERDAKMDQLRKKLRTDDEVNWVDPGTTLREQGVSESETVLLRRKFFFSDRNVDGRDPVQLGLLYVQARDAILDGTHPVTQDKACEFAGIQCQIQFGDHKEDKHTIGFLDTKEFLPGSYAKVKAIEKKVFKEHKRHVGVSELESKVLYTKTARSLKTYGVAFFLVKEKMKGKNKLVPRLLGVTKDSVLRLDEKTKEILQTWPLTTVRRWCASPNTFTLDFGDYSDQYYSVQTTEAEQILQVIAGYIDIILKKQRVKDHFGIEGDEGSTMVEDSVSPSKATILQHESQKIGKVNTESLAKPVVIRAGSEGAKPFATGHMTSAQLTTISGQINVGHTPPSASQMQQTKVTSVMSEPQRALLSTISSGQEIIKHTEKELSRAILSEIGTDPGSLKWKEVQLDTKKQVVTSHIAAMNAATAQVVTLTSGPTEEVDHTAVGAAITTITSNLPEMTKGVQMIAALMDDTDNGDKLLDATRKLCSAFSDLLKAAEPETKEPRQNLLNAASRVGEASTQVLYTIGEETEENKEIQDILLALAKAVANTTAALVLKAKNVAATCRGDQPAQNRVIAAATQCALATSQLVACAKVVAPTLDNPACKQQLNSAAQQVSRAVHALLEECSRAVGQDDGAEDGADDGEHKRLVGELQTAAADVSAALNQLLAHVEMDRRARETIHTMSLARVMSATERLMGSGGDAAEMVKQARLLGQVTAQLVQSIKTEAEQLPTDSEAQRALWAAARRLADATARMVEAARACASAPHEGARRDALRRAARELREVAGEYEGAVGGAGERDRVVGVLQQSAKQATSNATQLMTSAQTVAVHNTNKHSQEMLMQECRALADSMVQLVEAVRVSAARPSEASAQLELITASEAFLQPSGHVVQASRAVLPTVTDQPSAKQLSDTTHQFSTSCTELRSAVHRARQSCKGLELDAAAEVIRSLQRELDEVDRAAKAFQLKPLPGDTAESSQATLTNASRGAAGAVARLVSAARHGDEAGAERGAGDAAAALRQFAGGVRAVAATANDGDTRGRVVGSGQDVMASSLILIETTKKYFATSEKVETSHILGLAKDITHALDQTVEAVPSHRDLDITIENINETLQILSMGEFPPTDKSYGQLQQELNQAAANLNQASTDVVQTVENPSYLGEASRNYGDNFNQLLGVSMEMAGQTKDYEAQTQMVTSMRSVGACSSRLLGTAKSVCQDPTRPNARNQLAAAARSVTDAINHLVDVCTSAAPGQKECDNAVRSIQSTRPLLQNPSQPVNDLNYFSCVDTIIEQSKTLSEGMSGMANNTKRSDHEQFAHSVHTVSDSICGLVECTAQAAYLVAVSDETSVAGRPGLVDQAQFARASQAIEEACAGLMNPTSNQQQVLSAATVIAKHTSALCNACRVASSRTADPAAKRHFVQSAKDVANSTAALVKEIKALDNDYSEANRARCAQATSPLLDAVHSLCQFADSPEFASVPAKISIQAKRSQEAILESGRNIIKGSCSMVESAKVLAVQPTDKPQWQNLATHSKTVSDSIKSLVNNIRDKAPGQRECSVAVETLNVQMRELDQAALMAVSQSLQAKKGHSLQGYTEQIETTATEILERIEPLRVAAKTEAENLGHTVVQLVSYVEPLVQASIGAASNILETQTQMTILDQTKTVIEGATQLVLAAKESGGNPRATSAHADVEEQCAGTREAVQELMQSVRSLCTQHGLVSGLVDSVTRAVARITDHRMSLIGSYNEADSFVDYQTRMVGSAKEIARIATEMTSKSGTDVTKLATLAGELSQRYNQLAQDSVGAAATTTNNDVAQRIRSAVVDLGDGVVNLIKSGGQCQLTGDAQAQRQVADNSRHVNEKVGAVLAALQAGSKGTQACIDAVSTVAAIIGDLDTTILFASAGTLHAESDSDVFSDHRESILKTAKRLVEDTKTLVGGAAGSQEQLAAAAQNAVTTIVQLAEVVKLGAMSLGSSNPDSQVMLIHAVRDVAAALKDLIRATKDASGKHISDPAMAHLKDSAQPQPGADVKKRWSLPNGKSAKQISRIPSLERRKSSGFDLQQRINNKNGYNSSNYDSETDWFVSDQEEELIKLLDYSSQEDDAIIPVINSKVAKDVDGQKASSKWTLSELYEFVTKDSTTNMKYRIVKYAENILIGEIRNLVDIVERLHSKDLKALKDAKILKRKTVIDLDVEMGNINRIIDDFDDSEEKYASLNEETLVQPVKYGSKSKKIPAIKELDTLKFKNSIFKVKKVKPVNLEVNVPTDPMVAEVVGNDEFWNMFSAETSFWKALAMKNLEKNEETRRELERFSGHELVLAEYRNALSKFDEESKDLTEFIQNVDFSQSHNTKLVYDERYEDMILKLIDFAKKDFVYRGFDPLIDELKRLTNLEIEARKKASTPSDGECDYEDMSYKRLCQIERHYEEIINRYKTMYSTEICEVDNDNSYYNTFPKKRSHPKDHNKIDVSRKVYHTLTRDERPHTKIELVQKYPNEYYANNWWSIYEDVLRTRVEQFGSIDNWWNFYERVLRRTVDNEDEIGNFERNVKEHDRSRRDRLLKELEDVGDRSRFRETEDVAVDERQQTVDEKSVMVTNVTSLLKTVKAVEDEHTRGTRALEATIEAIAQEIRLLLSPGAPRLTATPEELVRCTKQITVATARAVAAGNTAKQDDVISAANLGRKAVGDVLAVCKGAAYHSADTEELRARTLSAGRDTAATYRELLQGVLVGLQTPQAKQQLQGLSRRVAAAAAEIVAVAEAMKGSDWVDPDDPTVIAENELLGAAASIDAAANKLAALRPRKNVKEADESLNFDEMILEAAKCIIAATAALVRAASAAQRELIDQGKVARRPVSSSDDGQWSEGLVSAARLVAAAAHSLVEAANALVQGYGSEEKLISSAKQVASSTAQLLVACKVKAEAGAESTRGLQAAGAAVIRSTDNLVRAARRAISHEDERSLVLNRRMVGGIAQEIDARSEVLRIERELEEARGRLTAIRQAKYKLRTGDASGDETDTELVIQHSDSSTDGRSYRNVSSANNSGQYAGSPGFNNGWSSGGNNQQPPKSPSDFQNKLNVSSYGNTTTHQQSVSQHSTLERQQYTSPPKAYQPPPVPSSPAQHLSTFQGYSGSPLPSAPAQNYEGFTTRQRKSSNKIEKRHDVPPRPSDEVIDVSPVRVTSGRVAVRQTAVITDSRLPSGASVEGDTSLLEGKPSPKIGNGTLPNGGQFAIREGQIADGSVPPEGVPPRRKKTAPPPPPRTAASRPRSYETRAYDTPRPIRNEYIKTDEEKRFENSQYSTLTKEDRSYGYESPRNVASPMSPKFNARFDLPKFESTRNESLYSTIQKPTVPKSPLFAGDNAHQSFSETRKSTETLPSGKIASEYSTTSESYQSYPKVSSEFSKVETVSKQNLPSSFITSTPAKQDFGSLKTNITSTDLVKAVTPDYSRDSISSPYGKDTYSYGGPNFMEETTTEVKEIPNGTQKITTTKIYSSSPVNLTSTNLKYDTAGLGVKPIRLEGLDELSKGFETSDSRFSTLESRKFGSDNSTTNRSFMRPSDFHDSEYQTAPSVTKLMKKPSDLAGELDKLDSRFSKQTISSSETIEKKTVMTSSSKSESSSTVTKKFGNF